MCGWTFVAIQPDWRASEIPRNRFRTPDEMPLAGCGLSPLRLHWGAGRAPWLVILGNPASAHTKINWHATFFDFYVTVSGPGCFPQKVTARVFGFVVKTGNCCNRCKRNKIANCQRFQTRDVSDGGQGGTHQNGGSRRLYLQESFMCMHVCTFMKHVRAYLFALIRARARAANARAMPCSKYACARA